MYFFEPLSIYKLQSTTNMFLHFANPFQETHSPLTNGDYLAQSSGDIEQDRTQISNAMMQICELHPGQLVKVGICLTHLTGVRPQNQYQYPPSIFGPRCYLIMDDINSFRNDCTILENQAMTITRQLGQCCNHNNSGGMPKNPTNAPIAVYVKIAHIGISPSEYKKRMQRSNDNQKQGLTPMHLGTSPIHLGTSPTHLGTSATQLGTAASQQADFKRAIGSGLRAIGSGLSEATQIHERKIIFDCCDTRPTYVCRSRKDIEKLYTLSLERGKQYGKSKSIRLQLRCKNCNSLTRLYSLADNDAKLTPIARKADKASKAQRANKPSKARSASKASKSKNSGDIGSFFKKM